MYYLYNTVTGKCDEELFDDWFAAAERQQHLGWDWIICS